MTRRGMHPVKSARAAGLHYVTDDAPGLSRVRAGRGFRYLDPGSRPIRAAATLKRIESLVIPPAWTQVWICPDPRGHIQATGRDERGRKQYLYHPDWRQVRDETKFDRLLAFAKALPKIRRTTARHLKAPGLGRDKVLAAVVQLLEKTFIRVGNDEYAQQNQHFGLTTLRDRHVDIHGADVHFEFKGKSGVHRTIDLHDRRLAKIIRNCQDLPGYELFQYLDEEGQRHRLTSTDVNDYLHRLTGQSFTAKDFRTWAGTLLAAQALQTFEPFESQTQAKKNVVRAVEQVAQRLGNTKAVCRKCYIHPSIIERYLKASLQPSTTPPARRGLHPEEAALVALLR